MPSKLGSGNCQRAMLTTILDYHTPILDIWQKPTLQIKWFYTFQSYTTVKNYLYDKYHVEWADRLRYYNGNWYGISTPSSECAWLETPEWYCLPFCEFVKLVDFKYHLLTTSSRKILNTYTTIYISSQYSIYEVFPDVSEEKLNKVYKYMEVNLLES